MHKKLTTLIATAVFLGACATGMVNPGTTATTSTTRHGLGSPVAMAFSLQPFDACAPLLDYVKQHALEMVGPYGLPYSGNGWFLVEDAVALESAPPAAGALRAETPAPETGFSTTNVQEAGVDEPDLVKTDGTRILAVAQNRLYYVDVTGGRPRLVSSLELENGWAQELLLSGDTVLVLSGSSYWDVPVLPEIWDPQLPSYGSGVSVLQQIDISDPSDLRIVRTLYVDGAYLSARMVGDIARVVIDSYPTGLEFVYPEGPGLRAEREALRLNRRVIEESTMDNWLPYYVLEERRGSRTITSEGVLVDCGQAYHPQEFSGLGTLSILTIDLSEGLAPAGTVSLFADGDTVYASPGSLFVATQRWYDWATLEGAADPRRALEGVTTQIHKFDISKEGPAMYRASGEVTGFLLNQWAMSEYDGKLRVASTTEPQWWGWERTAEPESMVSVLAERNGSLELIGRVAGLGRGERIYSVRYVDQLAYVVTFRQTDPLYTLDLSDPANPTMTGELKILGYSAYLHPIGDGLLLGIGQDADEQGRTKGTQVSVFDVSDPYHPQRLHTFAVDGGSSQVEYDHRAFLHWPVTGLTVLPVQTWSWDGSKESFFSGAIGVKADRKGIAEVGSITHGQSRCRPEAECWFGYQPQILRSMVVGDLVYTMSDGGIMASRLSDLTEVAWVPFD